MILKFVGIFLTGAVSAQAPLPPEVDAQFQLGVHAVVGCEGCHWEPPDKVPRANVLTVCGDCHPAAHDDYTTSVHWASGQAHAICTDCHGLHGILPVADPESKAHRSVVCGTCHTGPMEELHRGPHAEAFERTGAQECASCHSNHAVEHPTIAVIQPACETCHARDSDAYAFGEAVSAQFIGLRSDAENVDGRLDQARTDGYETRRAEEVLATSGAQFKQVRLVWHSLDKERIDEEARSTKAQLDRALVLIQERVDTQKMRETGIVVVWIIIAIGVGALYLKRKSIERARP